jgi:hypothetical protein
MSTDNSLTDNRKNEETPTLSVEETNPYIVLSQYHPSVKYPNKYFWTLSNYNKELLLHRLDDNIKMARETDDSDYFEYATNWLKTNGYTILTDLRTVTSKDKLGEILTVKPRIKIEIRKPVILHETTQTQVDTPRVMTHSKNKAKQHERANVMRNMLATKILQYMINDEAYLKSLQEVGYKVSADHYVRLADLYRTVLIYIAMKDLQKGTAFCLDVTLKKVLGNLNECSYYSLRKVLTQRLDSVN